MDWRPIETAPKDGSLVLLCSAETKAVALGKWWPEGTAWVDRFGRTGFDCYKLAQTGVWETEDGWFEPGEVSHFLPLPSPPGDAE